MIVYRITTAKWAGILSGSGYPARWNPKGVFVIYTASNRALACLENLVHRSGEGLNRQFKITEISVPDSSSSETINIYDLPGNWYETPHFSQCRQIGKTWIREGKSLLLRMPSAIVPDEHNVLINPNHPEFYTVSVQNIREFAFDKRLIACD